MIRNQKLIFTSTVISIFALFWLISSKVPLAGDDWAFYNNAMKYSLFDAAFNMYFNWEGRLATLFSVHFLIIHKVLWNIVNASIYTFIYIFFFKLVKPKKALLFYLSYLLVIFTMKENIRMEVITWITGSIYYGIPLLVSVAYLSQLYLVFINKEVKSSNYILAGLSALYLPIGMENIAIASISITLLFVVYAYVKEKTLFKFFISMFVLMMISYVVWFLSPGSSIRLAQMPEWGNLSLLGKLSQTLPNVLFFTFYQNKYLITLISLSLMVINHQTSKEVFIKFIFVFYGLTIAVLFSERLIGYFPNNFLLIELANGYSLITLIFFVIFAIVFVGNLIWLSIKLNKLALILFTSVAVISNAALLMSPVIGYRLMIYEIFYLLLVLLFIIEHIQISDHWYKGITLAVLIAVFVFSKSLLSKMNLVQSITLERQAILEDYKVYASQYKDGIWLPRYPIYSIHGGDIEMEDGFHMEAFKIYHQIPLNETLTFYWKESY